MYAMNQKKQVQFQKEDNEQIQFPFYNWLENEEEQWSIKIIFWKKRMMLENGLELRMIILGYADGNPQPL
jgi:hypothetical protein